MIRWLCIYLYLNGKYNSIIVVLGAEDKTLIIWETKRGLALTSLALHVPLLGFQITSDCSRIAIHLLDRGTNL